MEFCWEFKWIVGLRMNFGRGEDWVWFKVLDIFGFVVFFWYWMI